MARLLSLAGQGNFLMGAHCGLGEEHSAPTRWPIAPLIQTDQIERLGTPATGNTHPKDYALPHILNYLSLHGCQKHVAKPAFAKCQQIFVEIAVLWDETPTLNAQ